MNKRFRDGITDYFYLIDRNYPEKGTLKLVGDRYKLTGNERTILFRGIASRNKNDLRQAKQTFQLRQKHLIIDGYNCIFTLLNYLMGRPVFISSDGFCRDAGSLFGKIKHQKIFYDALNTTLKYVSNLRPERVTIYYDSPVSFSGEHRLITEKSLRELNLTGAVYVVHSADHEIRKYDSGIICTSDSAIIDASNTLVADITQMMLKEIYGAKLFEINSVLDKPK